MTTLQARSQSMTSWRLRGISDGALETLKWIALVAMTLDHLNKYVLSEAFQGMFIAGRIAMPLFAIVLGINLARPDFYTRGAYRRTAGRLALFGLIATVPFTLIGGPITWGWPVNILFALMVACGVIVLIEQGGAIRAVLAPVLFLIGGAAVEFWWVAPALCVGTWLWMREARLAGVLMVGAGFAGAQLINDNPWALASLPILFLALSFPLKTRRLGRFFYWFYPAHLVLLLAIKAWIL